MKQDRKLKKVKTYMYVYIYMSAVGHHTCEFHDVRMKKSFKCPVK